MKTNHRDACPAGDQHQCEEHEAVGTFKPCQAGKPDQRRAQTGKDKQSYCHSCSLQNINAEIKFKPCSQGLRKPYKEVIDVSWGDPHRAGLKPLSFVRQVTCDHQQSVQTYSFYFDYKFLPCTLSHRFLQHVFTLSL